MNSSCSKLKLNVNLKHQNDISCFEKQEMIKEKVLTGEYKTLFRKYYNLIQEKVKDIELKRFYKDMEIITFDEFFKNFALGNFGKIANSFSSNKDYVKDYYDFFSKNGRFDKECFKEFYFLYYLEGQLLIADKHPTLSSKFSNFDSINDGKPDDLTMDIYNAAEKLTDTLFHMSGLNDLSLVSIDNFMKLLHKTHLYKKIKKNVNLANEFDNDAIRSFKFFLENTNSVNLKGNEFLSRPEFVILYASLFGKESRNI